MTLENNFVRYGIIDLVRTQNFPKMLRVHIRRLQILVFLKIVRTCQIDDGYCKILWYEKVFGMATFN